MSCCGNKRNEWLSTSKPQPGEHIRETPAQKDQPGRIFEYTGEHSLSVTGAASGKIYQFKNRGHRVIVEYGDSFALMAWPELKVLPL